jgi:hypothetical protein
VSMASRRPQSAPVTGVASTDGGSSLHSEPAPQDTAGLTGNPIAFKKRSSLNAEVGNPMLDPVAPPAREKAEPPQSAPSADVQAVVSVSD